MTLTEQFEQFKLYGYVCDAAPSQTGDISHWKSDDKDHIKQPDGKWPVVGSKEDKISKKENTPKSFDKWDDLPHSKYNLNFTGDTKPVSERQKTLINQEPIEININDYIGKTPKEAKHIAKDKYRQISVRTMLNPIKKDGIDIQLPMSAFSEIKQHIADRKVLYVMGHIDKLLENAVFMFPEKNTDPKKQDTINFLNYGVKTKIDGEDYFTRLVIREDKKGNFFYDNDSTEVKKIKAKPRLNSGPTPGHHENSPYTNRITQWLLGVKSNVNNKHDRINQTKDKSLSQLFHEWKGLYRYGNIQEIIRDRKERTPSKYILNHCKA